MFHLEYCRNRVSIMTRYICNQCHNSYASSQSLWNHKQRCKGKPNAKSTNPRRYSLQHESLMRGGSLKSDETLRKIFGQLLDNKEETVDEEKIVDTDEDDSGSDQTLDTEIDVRPLATAMFEDITENDKRKFMQLLSELKDNLKNENFEIIDALIPHYWNNEFRLSKEWWNRPGQAIGEKILQELRGFQRKKPSVSLEMQILLSFMEKKRDALNKMLNAMESDKDKEELLENEFDKGIITEAEKNELLNNLNRDTIRKVLSQRKFDLEKLLKESN